MKKGLTLVEILISMLIFSFIMAGIFGILNIGNSTWSRDMALLELQQNTRLALSGMISEIRQANVLPAAGTSITFTMPSDIAVNPIIYRRDAATNQIIREHPAGVTKVIANNIYSLNFTPIGTKVVKIDIIARKTIGNNVIDFPMSEQVRLRNVN